MASSSATSVKTPRNARASARSIGPCPAAAASALVLALGIGIGTSGCKGDGAAPSADGGTDLAALCAPTPPTGPSLMFTADGGCTGVIENHPVEGCSHVPCPGPTSYAS